MAKRRSSCVDGTFARARMSLFPARPTAPAAANLAERWNRRRGLVLMRSGAVRASHCQELFPVQRPGQVLST